METKMQVLKGKRGNSEFCRPAAARQGCCYLNTKVALDSSLEDIAGCTLFHIPPEAHPEPGLQEQGSGLLKYHTRSSIGRKKSAHGGL